MSTYFSIRQFVKIFQSQKNAQLGRYFFATAFFEKSSCEKIFPQLENFKPVFRAFWSILFVYFFLKSYY